MPVHLASQPAVISRAEHNVSRADIDENALKVLYRLHNAGFQAYLVGGCVRDLLLSRHPKDFDVVTDAHPEQIKHLFNNCRLIGRRFRLAHILFGRDVVEVATFRGDGFEPGRGERLNTDDGRILRDNVYGTIHEDVWRRDFTMNALYYNIADFTLVDYVDGLGDIRSRRIRLIGEPERSYREDPVRMLRAVRFAAKLDFHIDREAAEPIETLAGLLSEIPLARLFDEVLKLFHGGAALNTFRLLDHYGLLVHLFPETATCLQRERYAFARPLIEHVLENTDARINAGKSVTPACLYAAFLWLPLLETLGHEPGDPAPGVTDIQKAGSRAIGRQSEATAIPRRFTSVMREIWGLQPRLQRYTGKRALRLLHHPRFRAAYDFLCLRARAGEPVGAQADWWTEVQEKPPGEQARMADAKQSPGGQRRRRRRAPRKRRRAGAGPPSDSGS